MEKETHKIVGNKLLIETEYPTEYAQKQLALSQKAVTHLTGLLTKAQADLTKWQTICNEI